MVQTRREETLDFKLHWYSKFYNLLFIQKKTLIYIRGNFVYHYWECKGLCQWVAHSSPENFDSPLNQIQECCITINKRGVFYCYRKKTFKKEMDNPSFL